MVIQIGSGLVDVVNSLLHILIDHYYWPLLVEY